MAAGTQQKRVDFWDLGIEKFIFFIGEKKIEIFYWPTLECFLFLVDCCLNSTYINSNNVILVYCCLNSTYYYTCNDNFLLFYFCHNLFLGNQIKYIVKKT